MRSTRTTVYLAAIGVSCVGLLFLFSNSSSSGDAKNINPRIQDLQKKRVAILERVLEEAKVRFMSARESYTEVHAARIALSAARIEYAATQQDRLKVCDEAIKDALDMQAFASEMVKSGRSSHVEELNAEAWVLETQIRREKAMVE